MQYILILLAHGASIDEILSEYEGLSREDVLACLLYAATYEDSHRFQKVCTVLLSMVKSLWKMENKQIGTEGAHI